MKRGIQIIICFAVLVAAVLYTKDTVIPVSNTNSLQGVVVCVDPGHGGATLLQHLK